eukprot:TRINITY_DN66583_c0_g1_i1.p1 TRINITY_DN66583_c0_g1~~TRINITY_DN66583_c0_g1_i1.p1  ORF type:complete len:340 (+),score=47.35 TRINITY_DN66583_c0_g1_i1:52-1020(+)
MAPNLCSSSTSTDASQDVAKRPRHEEEQTETPARRPMAFHWSQQYHTVSGDGGLAKDLAFLRSRADLARSSGKRPIVLVTSGSWSPPHRGHLELLHAARAALPSDEPVCGAVLIPSSDLKLREKLGDGPLPFECDALREPGIHRLPRKERHTMGALPFELRSKMMSAMAEDMNMSDWVHVTEAEQSRGQFYLGVLEHLSHAATSAFEEADCPRFVWVTGSDRPKPLYERFHGDGVDGVVVVPREGDKIDEVLGCDPLRVVSKPVPDGGESFSSTKLRESVERVLHAGRPEESLESAIEEAASPYMTPSAARMYAEALMAKEQ